MEPVAPIPPMLDRDTVHVLVFELAGQLYGVDVDQVEAIIAAEPRDGFCSYDGQDVPVRDLALWIGTGPSRALPSRALGTGGTPPRKRYSADGTGARPRVLLSRSCGTLQGFLVDTPQDIIALPVVDIFPMPKLIQRVLGPTPLWGVGRSPGGLLLLVDLAASLPPAAGGLAPGHQAGQTTGTLADDPFGGRRDTASEAVLRRPAGS